MISGLYLSLLCQLKDNINEKGDVILFEVGTGVVHSFISGMNSIVKTKFDFSGKYIIVIGNNGEIYLLGLDKDAVNSIQNCIEELNKNPNFLKDYEILFNNEKNGNNSYKFENDLNKNFEFRNLSKTSYHKKETIHTYKKENEKNNY